MKLRSAARVFLSGVVGDSLLQGHPRCPNRRAQSPQPAQPSAQPASKAKTPALSFADGTAHKLEAPDESEDFCLPAGSGVGAFYRCAGMTKMLCF